MKKILHFHIPKTGGQTLSHRIAESLPLSKSWYMQGGISEDNYKEILEDQESDYIFLSAHVSGEALINQKNCDIVCLIRDPVDQIISNYAHIRREPENILYDLANNVPFSQLIASCPEWFCNVQSRYLVAALRGRSGKNVVETEERWLLSELIPASDLVKWLVPTENLDEFCFYLSIETGLLIDDGGRNLNIANSKGSAEMAGLRSWLLERPHLYALDTILYNEAKRRFAHYRRELRAKSIATGPLEQYSRDANLLFRDGGGELRAGHGWYPLGDTEGWGLELRAGPQLDSVVHISRGRNHKYLCFDLAFVAGLEPEELEFIALDTGEKIPATIDRSGKNVVLKVSLAGLKRETDLLIRAPRIFPLSKFDRRWTESTTPVSFSTGNWKLVGA